MTILAATMELDNAPFEKGLNRAAGLAKTGAAGIATFFIRGAAAATGFAVAVGGAAVKAAADFEAKMASVDTLLTDAAEGSLERLRMGILALPPELGRAADLTEGLYQAISAGTAPAQAIDRVAQSAKLARAGLADLGSTTKALSGFINAYGKNSVGAAEASDLLFTVVQRGVFELPELAQQLGRVSSQANAAGVSQVELSAALANITKTGLPARQAVSGLGAALANVIKPGPEVLAFAKSAGIEFGVAAIQSKGLAGFLQEVVTATDGNVESLAKLFGSVEGVNAVLSLTQDNLSGFREDLEAFGVAAVQGGAITEEAFRKQSATFNAQLATVRAGLDRILIDIGTPLLGELKKVTTGIIDNLDTIRPAIIETSRFIIDGFGAAGETVGNIWNAVSLLIEGRSEDAADAATMEANRIATAFADTFPDIQRELDLFLDAAIFTFDKVSLEATLGAQAVKIGFLAGVRGAAAVFETLRMVVVGVMASAARGVSDFVSGFEVEMQAVFDTTADLAKAMGGLFFQIGGAANVALGGIGDTAVKAVQSAIRGISTIANEAGKQLLASGIPGIAAAGQGLRLLSVDITGAASLIDDQLGNVEKRQRALTETQKLFNQAVDAITPTGAGAVGALEDLAEGMETLAKPSETVGAAIATIEEEIRATVRAARETNAELQAIKAGQEFDLGVDAIPVGPEAKAAAQTAEDDAIAEAAKAGQDKLSEIEKKGSAERNRLIKETRKKQLGASSSFFNSLSQIAGNRSKKLFNIAKGVGIATGTINAFTSFTEALKNPPGPPFTIPTAAAGLAAGLAQVASIKSQQLPSFQAGGIMRRAGLARVGELGEELVELPAGARVRPAGVTADIAGGARLSIGTFNFQPSEPVTPDNAEEQAELILDALVERLERGENTRFIDELGRQLAVA